KNVPSPATVAVSLPTRPGSGRGEAQHAPEANRARAPVLVPAARARQRPQPPADTSPTSHAEADSDCCARGSRRPAAPAVGRCEVSPEALHRAAPGQPEPRARGRPGDGSTSLRRPRQTTNTTTGNKTGSPCSDPET